MLSYRICRQRNGKLWISELPIWFRSPHSRSGMTSRCPFSVAPALTDFLITSMRSERGCKRRRSLPAVPPLWTCYGRWRREKGCCQVTRSLKEIGGGGCRSRSGGDQPPKFIGIGCGVGQGCYWSGRQDLTGRHAAATTWPPDWSSEADLCAWSPRRPLLSRKRTFPLCSARVRLRPLAALSDL